MSLALFDPSLPVWLMTDASDFAIAGCLLQPVLSSEKQDSTLVTLTLTLPSSNRRSWLFLSLTGAPCALVQYSTGGRQIVLRDVLLVKGLTEPLLSVFDDLDGWSIKADNSKSSVIQWYSIT